MHRFWSLGPSSDRDDVLRLGTFLAVGDFELHFLPVSEGAETIALDRAEMHEDVGAVLAFNEAESLALVKPFNGAGSCRHTCYLYYLRRRVQAPLD